jgi:hypothetical protein
MEIDSVDHVPCHISTPYNSAYMNIGRRSLGICSQAFCRVFVCAVIHTAKRRTSLVLKSGAIHSLDIIEMIFSDICVIQSAYNVFMYPTII